jgi:arylsulfatase A-like enzyme
MRVPFIAAWAKADANNPDQKRLPIPAGVIQSQQAAVQDLFPTILAVAGRQAPRDHIVDGVRLDTLLAGKDPVAPKLLMHYPHSPHRSNYWSSLRSGPGR